MKQGLPKGHESLPGVLNDSRDFFLGALKSNSEAIKAYPHIKFEVVGYTDDQECDGHECLDLSVRRAKLVYDWLIADGVPAVSLKGPVGRGSGMPIDDNATAAGRSRNRRVEINAFVDSP